MRMLSVSNTMRSRLRRDGYLTIPDAVDQGTLAGLRAAADLAFERVVGETLADRITHSRLTWWRLPDGRPYVFKIKPVADLAPPFHEMTSASAIRDVASVVLGANAVLMEDKVTYKTALTEDAAWADLPILGEDVRKHSDAAYFAARGFGQVITMALCLDDCPAEAGALQVWPGSHERPARHQPTANQGPVVTDEDAPDEQAVTLEAGAGTLLTWDAALVHASGPNRTDRPRRLLVLGYTASNA
ncbi:phytanoyl-CoA dioxygenase family protein [Micromonospora echinospora]